jgi:hypothetical protein
MKALTAIELTNEETEVQQLIAFVEAGQPFPLGPRPALLGPAKPVVLPKPPSLVVK